MFSSVGWYHQYCGGNIKVLMGSLKFTPYIPPLYWMSSTVLKIPLHRIDGIPLQYGRYPATSLIVYPTVMMIPTSVLSIPHGIKHPPQYCKVVPQPDLLFYQFFLPIEVRGWFGGERGWSCLFWRGGLIWEGACWKISRCIIHNYLIFLFPCLFSWSWRRWMWPVIE